MNYVRAVPVLRTPAGLDAFDYAVPEGLNIRVGDVVWVPFRRRKTPALVVEMLKTSAYAGKAQPVDGSYAELRLPEASVKLLHWLSDWTFTSQPAVLLSWMRTLPKKPGQKNEINKEKVEGSMEARWTEKPDAELLEAAMETKGRTLIITPWLASARRLSGQIPESSLLLADQADGTYFDTWTDWAISKNGTLITTRVGAWLSPIADDVLLHLPEQDDHKQDEQSPRYDARRIAAWSAQHAGTRVHAFGVTPPLSSDEPAPTIDVACDVRTRSPKGHSPIPAIQADVLNLIRDHQGPRVVIHGIRGKAARFVCRDCGWHAICPRCEFSISDNGTHAVCRRCGWTGDAPLSCLSCGGLDLGKSLPGIDKLKQAWQKHEADVAIEWHTLAVDDMEAPFPSGCLVVVTDASLLCGVAEDIRRDERLMTGIRHLASRVHAANGSLVLQSPEHETALIESCLTSDGFSAYRLRERALRQEFKYPPTTRLVKAITTKPTLSFQTAGFELRGPFPILFRPKSRQERYVYHILPPKDVSQRNLMDQLKPLTKTALLDLDPINFFR